MTTNIVAGPKPPDDDLGLDWPTFVETWRPFSGGLQWIRRHAWVLGDVEVSIVETCDAENGRVLHPVPHLQVAAALSADDDIDQWDRPERVAEICAGLRGAANVIERLHAASGA